MALAQSIKNSINPSKNLQVVHPKTHSQPIHPPQVIRQLEGLYEDVDDIDIFIGGVSERPMEGSLLGHTFLCIVGDQFARLRVADAAVVLSFPLCLLL